MTNKDIKQKIYFGIDNRGKFITLNDDQVDWQYECGCKESEHNKIDYCPIHNKPSFRLDIENKI